MTPERLRRSALYAPADDPDMLAGALESGADAVIFDLEDAVPAADLPAARENVVDAAPAAPEGVEVCARVNGPETDAWLEDLLAVAPAVDGVVLPKVETPEQVATYAAVARRAADGGGSARSATAAESGATRPELIVTVETPRGLFAADEIAARGGELPGVTALSFGLADYTAAVGAAGTPEATRTFVAQTVVAAASVGDLDPLYTVYRDHTDHEGLRATAEAARETGYVGLKAIHPDQVDVINDVFTPGEDEVARARRLVEAYEAAERDSIAVEGTFLDRAVVEQYRTVLARHRAVADE